MLISFSFSSSLMIFFIPRYRLAVATSCSVDPNRSPMTLIACRIAVVIFVI
jgi:hypothetical protein